MATRVPVFKHCEIINWPSQIESDRISKLAHYSHETGKCVYCESETVRISALSDEPEKDSTPVYFRQCGRCGFYFARGTRGYADGPAWNRFMFGTVTLEEVDSATIDTHQLIRFLNKERAHITSINPFKAEDVVVELLRDFLQCEIRKVGGRKDGGIDAYAIKGDKISALIQIKWRRESGKAEGVEVIRSVAGTQLIKGIPKALVFTTRKKYSNQARKEMLDLHGRELVHVGRMSMDLKTYDDILDMLEITTRRISDNPIPPPQFESPYDLF